MWSFVGGINSETPRIWLGQTVRCPFRSAFSKDVRRKWGTVLSDLLVSSRVDLQGGAKQYSRSPTLTVTREQVPSGVSNHFLQLATGMNGFRVESITISKCIFYPPPPNLQKDKNLENKVKVVMSYMQDQTPPQKK